MSGFRNRIWDRGVLREIARAGGPRISLTALDQERARFDHIDMPGIDCGTAFKRTIASGLLATTEILERSHGLPRRDAVRIVDIAHRANKKRWVSAVIGARPGPKRHPLVALRQVTRRPHSVACEFTDYFWNAGRSDLARVLGGSGLHC